MINIMNCNIQCPLGDFEDAITSLQEKGVGGVVINGCHINLTDTEPDGEISDHIKLYYRMSLSGNVFVQQDGNMYIENQTIGLQPGEDLACFINNSVRLI